jgi:hypothetical protein
MSAPAVRQRSLLPIGTGGTLQGWMDEDAASAAGQLFGSGPRGVLVIDARELLSSTARVVGAALGELHFKAWMALVTLHVVHGMPEDGRATTTLGELARLVWGARENSGKDNFALLDVMHDLRDAKFTVPGYDLVNQRPADGVSDTSLLINLFVDETILKGYTAEKARRELARRKREVIAEHRGGQITAVQRDRDLAAFERELATITRVDRAAFGKQLGGKGRGTLAWRMHPDYTQRLGETELRRFDWTKARAMRGVALTLWMGFTSPRMPYRPVFDAGEPLEVVEIPLTLEHCHALGVRSGADAARRRTFNDAGARVCAADRTFRAFEAHGGRGMDSFLRVVRTPPAQSVLDRPGPTPPPGQLTLTAGA